MKKYGLLLGLVFLMNACSSSDEDNSGGPLIKEIQSETVSGDFTSQMVFRYSYNGNKIKSIKSGTSWQSLYTYAGDLITKIENYHGQDLMFRVYYEYDDEGKMIREQVMEFQEGAAELYTYTYNSDNTITKLTYNGMTENPANLSRTSRLVLDASARIVRQEDLEGSAWVTKIQATFTDHNSPLRNIVGFNKLLTYGDASFAYATYEKMNPNGIGLYNSSVFAYTVNGADYPIYRTQTLTNQDGSTSVTTSNYIYY